MSDYFDNSSYNATDFPLKVGSGGEFVECQFSGIDFSEHNFSRLKFLDCTFTECNLSNVSMRGANIRGCTFKKSRLIGLNFAESSSITSTNFYESILDYCVFQSMSLKGIIFSDCRLLEVDFYEAQLNKAIFSGSILKGAIFNKANLTEADFRNAHEYFIDVRQATVKKAKFNLPEAISLLSSLEIVIE